MIEEVGLCEEVGGVQERVWQLAAWRPWVGEASLPQVVAGCRPSLSVK